MKRIKKLLSLLLSAVLVLSMAVPVFAAGEDVGFSLKASETALEIGEEFTVAATIDTNENGIASVEFQLTYDESVVEFTGFETTYDEDTRKSLLVSDFSNGATMTFADESAFVAFARGENIYKTGTLFTANFKAIAAGDAKIGYVVSEVAKFNDAGTNTENVSYAVDTTAANVTVEAPIAETGYTVSLTPSKQEKALGEIAEVKVNVDSKEEDTFNTVYAELTYDSAYLSYKGADSNAYEITDSDGKLTLITYGEDKAVGEELTLQFELTAKPESEAVVTLTQANIDVNENADVQDAPAAVIGSAEAAITMSGYAVTLPDDFIGDSVVESGDDYTFTAKDKYYDYTFSATMGDETVEVKDNGDGTYTVKDVTGKLVIEVATKTGKSFSVTTSGGEANQVICGTTAVHGTNYAFTVAEAYGYSTAVTVKIGGYEYSYTIDSDGSYVILGKDITGDIEIIVTNTASDHKINFSGTGAGDVVEKDLSVITGGDLTFTLNKDDAYIYTVTALMGDEPVEVIENADGSYTIKNVTGDLVITITKEAKAPIEVEVSEYVKVDDFVVYLVTAAKNTSTEGTALTYDGNVMSWSDAYDAYAYLVISDEVLTEEAAAEKVEEISVANVETIDYTGDVNGTGVIDVNDAQLVYDIYNAEYQTFTDFPMSKFLRADVNADKLVDVEDAAAVVNTILGTN